MAKQKHDLGHQKRRKNAEALKRQQDHREAQRQYGRNLTPSPTGSNPHSNEED